MDLSFLIPSKVRRAVLAYFVDNPEAKICIRELARELKLPPQQVYRELLNLEGWGLLFSSKQANQRVFRLNGKFPLYPSVCELFRQYRIEHNRTYKIHKVYNLDDIAGRYENIPVPAELIPGLTAKRKKPRAFAEEKILRKKGML